MKTLFTLSTHEYMTGRFATVEELETFAVQQIMYGRTLADLAREHVTFLDSGEMKDADSFKSACKEAGKRLVVRLQLEDRSFKTSDKLHRFYRSYDAYMTELRKLSKGVSTSQGGREFSIESEVKRVITMCEKHSGLKQAIIKALS